METRQISTATGVAQLGEKGRLTIPKVIRDLLGISNGDKLLIRMSGNTAEIVPMALVPRDQVWFYTVSMQDRILDAELDIAAGRTETVTSVEELEGFLGGLESDEG